MLLRRYVLLLGSCNVVAGAKLAPVASRSSSTSAGHSIKAYPVKVDELVYLAAYNLGALKHSSFVDVCRAALLVLLHSVMAIFC